MLLFCAKNATHVLLVFTYSSSSAAAAAAA